MLPVTQEDREILQPIVTQMGIEMPTMKMSVYKNRRGRYKDILMWCKTDLGICRIEPMFITNYRMELLEIPDLKINVTAESESTAY